LKYHPQTGQPMSSTRIIQKAQQEAEAFFWKTLGDRKATFPREKKIRRNCPFLHGIILRPSGELQSLTDGASDCLKHKAGF
jgi:hypothetical protein